MATCSKYCRLLNTLSDFYIWISVDPVFPIIYSEFHIIFFNDLIWWLAPSPHSERVPGSIPTWGLSVWSLHVLPVYAWVLSGFPGFLPPSKNMHVGLIGDSKKKIVLRSECERAWLFVSFVSVWPCDGLATCPGCTPPLAR